MTTATESRGKGWNGNRRPPTGASRMSAWLSTDILGWMRERLQAVGRAPTDIPDEKEPRLLRLQEVSHATGLSSSTIYAWIKSGRFPKPVPLDVPHGNPQQAA